MIRASVCIPAVMFLMFTYFPYFIRFPRLILFFHLILCVCMHDTSRGHNQLVSHTLLVGKFYSQEYILRNFISFCVFLCCINVTVLLVLQYYFHI